MQLEGSFIGLAIMDYEHYTMLRQFFNSFGRFHFYFSLIFYIFGAFLIKQLFHSRLLDMR